MSLAKAFLLAFLTVRASAIPTSLTPSEDAKAITRRSVTPSSQGMNNGFFYSMWSDGTGDVEYTNGGAGQYSLTWSNSGDVVVGKGFNPGAPRNITYNADYEPNGISFLSVYGWFTDPLTEYYICENYGSGSPAGGDGMIHKGQFESDGSTYDVYEHQQVNAPSIQGTTNFMQYWSIRTDRRTSGTINTANHYNYWKSLGLQIGTFNYQILATEGVKSSGKSTVTVSEGGSDAGSSSGTGSASSAAASTVPSVKPTSSAAQVASSASSVSYSAAGGAGSSTAQVASLASSALSSAAAGAGSSAPTVAAPAPSDTSSASYGNSPSSINAPGVSSAAGGFPSFGGQTPGAPSPSGGRGGHHTPGASFPFGGGVSHHTPCATPTPHFGHHGHHGGAHLHYSGGAYKGGMPNGAGANSATAAPSSPY